MKKENIINEYKKYRNKIGNRKELYRKVIEKYAIKAILYPGSHIDIVPSLICSNVIYVDNFRGAISFFKHMDIIKSYVKNNKEYDEACEIIFKPKDYRKKLDISSVDLIISQYAGFVGQATKKYLKKGGILLSNDSHGDATLAKFDKDYKFIN